MTHFEMYLFTRLDTLSITATVLLVLSAALCFFAGVVWGVESSGYNPSESILMGAKRVCRASFGISVACLLLVIAVPTQKEAAAIYLVPKIVNNEQVQDIAGKSLDILTLKLNEWVADLTLAKKAE